MTAVVTPLPASTMRSAFFKLGARRYLVISIVMVAVVLDVVEGIVRDARIAVGACSAVAKRMREAERRLIGAPAGPGLGRSIEARISRALSPIDDVRATADYRRDAALTLLRRAIELARSAKQEASSDARTRARRLLDALTASRREFSVRRWSGSVTPCASNAA